MFSIAQDFLGAEGINVQMVKKMQRQESSEMEEEEEEESSFGNGRTSNPCSPSWTHRAPLAE